MFRLDIRWCGTQSVWHAESILNNEIVRQNYIPIHCCVCVCVCGWRALLLGGALAVSAAAKRQRCAIAAQLRLTFPVRGFCRRRASSRRLSPGQRHAPSPARAPGTGAKSAGGRRTRGGAAVSLSIEKVEVLSQYNRLWLFFLSLQTTNGHLCRSK